MAFRSNYKKHPFCTQFGPGLTGPSPQPSATVVTWLDLSKGRMVSVFFGGWYQIAPGLKPPISGILTSLGF